MSDTTTRGIRIQVTTSYFKERSSPEKGLYLFTYKIRITNTGDETAQLISRTWIITDSEGRVEEVKGPGVVGEQPVLAPGESFEYRSYCPLRTPVGTMQGSYQMVDEHDRKFDAEIDAFTLAIPHSVH